MDVIGGVAGVAGDVLVEVEGTVLVNTSCCKLMSMDATSSTGPTGVLVQ